MIFNLSTAVAQQERKLFKCLIYSKDILFYNKPEEEKEMV